MDSALTEYEGTCHRAAAQGVDLVTKVLNFVSTLIVLIERSQRSQRFRIVNRIVVLIESLLRRMSPSTGTTSRCCIDRSVQKDKCLYPSRRAFIFLSVQKDKCLNVLLRRAFSPSRSSQRSVTGMWRRRRSEVASSAFSSASSASPSCSPSSLMSAAFLPGSCRLRNFSQVF